MRINKIKIPMDIEQIRDERAKIYKVRDSFRPRRLLSSEGAKFEEKYDALQ